MDTTQGTMHPRRPRARKPATAAEVEIFGPDQDATAPTDPCPPATPAEAPLAGKYDGYEIVDALAPVAAPAPIPGFYDSPTPPATGAAQLAEQVRRVHDMRQELAHRADLLGAARQEFELAHATELLDIKEWSLRVDAAEMALKALTLVHYTATGEKRPVAGVEVKEKTELVYDPAQAFTWAREKQLALVPESLDRRAFEKIAKATPLEFVTEKITPVAQIATDLAKVLGGGQ
jgi:hypothetical protein